MLPGALRWLGGLVVAGAIAAFLAIGNINGDPRLASVVAFLLGVALVMLGTLLERPAVVRRVRLLQGHSFRLAATIRNGHRLYDDLRRADDHSTEKDALIERTRAWRAAFYGLVERLGDRAVAHLGDREQTVIQDDVLQWRRNCMYFLETHLPRLDDLLKEQR